ncbi:ferritin-like domain-containing protein [Sphingomonas sp. SORGH_AS_0950]|uniref:ferritin-like domain-containing protein n=1 Tax=Sphingomonas sp. SORGH_AS_0950 TaxID=3041792 RepID=UPI0027D8055F|nr:ferritin-like domain-containing protein [Sphingomonas sp. SORGH_AS_0950]
MIRWFGTASAMAGGLALLEGCNDDVVGSENVKTPTPTASATSTPTPPPSYTATDNDRLNFILQLHYLYGTYLVRGLNGTSLPAALTTGSGTAGGVSGGQAVTFTDSGMCAAINEVANAVLGRIGFLRRTLGAAVTAQPALNIAGGQNGPFDAIARVPSDTPPTSYFNPYSAQDEFLLGAVALSAVTMTASIDQSYQVSSGMAAALGAFAASVGASDGIIRNALYQRSIIQSRTLPAKDILFERSWRMAEARNRLDGPRDLDHGIGWFDGDKDFGSRIPLRDGANWIALRRTPEEALGILYASGTSVSAGGFFPSGLNGLIKTSGINIV